MVFYQADLSKKFALTLCHVIFRLIFRLIFSNSAVVTMIKKKFLKIELGANYFQADIPQVENDNNNGYKQFRSQDAPVTGKSQDLHYTHIHTLESASAHPRPPPPPTLHTHTTHTNTHTYTGGARAHTHTHTHTHIHTHTHTHTHTEGGGGREIASSSRI